MANIASRCAIDYGAMGAVGFKYQSIKDELRWARLDVSRYTHLLNRVGNLFCMPVEEYEKAKVKTLKMRKDEIASKLIAMFGKGDNGL